MDLINQQFNKAKELFLLQEDIQEGVSIMKKITTLVNELAQSFVNLDGGSLSDYQMKLSGYKFYLADQIAELMAKSEYTKAWIKDQRAILWKDIEFQIKEAEGKIKNKEQIENALLISLRKEINDQIFYESQYQKLKLKSFAIDDILTVIVQRIAELKRQINQVS